MPANFKKRVSDSLSDGVLNIGRLSSSGNLTSQEVLRLEKIREAWNFYEGYHWEGIDDEDSPQVTFNYVRTFVNKFVSFEIGKGFTIKTNEGIAEVGVTIDDTKIDSDSDIDGDGVLSDEEVSSDTKVLTEKTSFDFLEQVWENNNKDVLLEEIGQTKSITGEAWVKVDFEEPSDKDVFGEFPQGKITLKVVPTQYVFPTFNQHNIKELESVLIMYPIEKEEEIGLLRKRSKLKTVLYKEVWTADEITIYENDNQVDNMINPYGIIPFVQIKNRIISGRAYGMSDIEDIIPINVEYNLKQSDVSEIIDYHAAPITLVYGSKIGNLEKGANKVWGGLPKDGRVENLSLSGDLVASQSYIKNLKTSMCEIGGVPETVIGGASAISNTSGVALQYMNGPLIEITRSKRHNTENGIELVNKIILYIGLTEGLIQKPEIISMKDFLANKVTLPDTLPKDDLIELQKISEEMKLGLECRHGAMERLGKDDIVDKLNEIDSEREEHPELFNPMLQTEWYNNKINSGMMNGQTPIEEVRKETTGQNGGVDDEI